MESWLRIEFSSLVALKGIQSVESLKSVHFDDYLQEEHSELCMCKLCVFARFDEAHFEGILFIIHYYYYIITLL